MNFTDPDPEHGLLVYTRCQTHVLQHLYSTCPLLQSHSLLSETMDNSTLAIDNSKRRHTSSSHTSSQLDTKHAGLRHTDTSLSGLVTGTPARNHRTIIQWWIVSCVSFLVCTPLVSVLLGLHLHARDFQYLDNNFTFTGRTVRLFYLFFVGRILHLRLTLDYVRGNTHQC